jgi:hypothetical protein
MVKKKYIFIGTILYCQLLFINKYLFLLYLLKQKPSRFILSEPSLVLVLDSFSLYRLVKLARYIAFYVFMWVLCYILFLIYPFPIISEFLTCWDVGIEKLVLYWGRVMLYLLNKFVILRFHCFFNIPKVKFLKYCYCIYHCMVVIDLYYNNC